MSYQFTESEQSEEAIRAKIEKGILFFEEKGINWWEGRWVEMRLIYGCVLGRHYPQNGTVPGSDPFLQILAYFDLTEDIAVELAFLAPRPNATRGDLCSAKYQSFADTYYRKLNTLWNKAIQNKINSEIISPLESHPVS